MRGGQLFVGNLGLKFDDVCAASKQGKRLLASPYGFSESRGEHNSLEAHSTDGGSNKKQAVPVFDFGRFIDVKTGFETDGHSTRLSWVQASERREVPPRFLSEPLTNDISIITARLSDLRANRGAPTGMLPHPENIDAPLTHPHATLSGVGGKEGRGESFIITGS